MEQNFHSRPLYSQLVGLLVNRIQTTMLPHDLLPSERELSKSYGVSRTTVRLALKELEEQGYIYRRHGKGTFVADVSKTVTDLSNAYSFTEQMTASGRKPQTLILGFETTEADAYVAQHLNQPLGTAVFKLHRLRLADDVPMMLELSYLPVKYFLSLTKERIETKPLYTLFAEEFHQVIRVAEEEFYASIAEKDAAEMLKIPEKAPVFHLVRQTYNTKNEIIEFTKSVARADQFHYKIRHVRQLNDSQSKI